MCLSTLPSRSAISADDRTQPDAAPTPSLATGAPVTAGAAASSTCTTVISLPWTAPAFASVKGVVHQPEAKPSQTRDPGRYSPCRSQGAFLDR
jgi:hypothetical protein